MSVLLLLLILSCFTPLIRAQEGCQRSPLWMFFRHEDVRTIYPSLPDVFVLVDGGEVDQLVTSPDPSVAELFFLGTDVAEFPINWCISSDEFEVLRYSISLRSLDPSVLAHPNMSLPSQGTITSQPYRFRIMLRCLASSPTNPYVRVNITLSSSNSAINFCPVVFYFARDCQGAESDEIPTELTILGITDGYVDFNATFKDPLLSVPSVHRSLGVILPAVIVPLVVVTLVPLAIALSLWLTWYRRKSKALASFELEDVSTAYQQVRNPWTKRGPHDKEFPPENLNMTRELGEGAFGVVYQAEALGILGVESEWTDVAVKQLRQGSNEADDFFREVDFMSKLDHPSVIKLLGVCSLEEPFSMIFEYMDLGDLCSFLREAIGLGKDDNDKKGKEEDPGNQDEEDKFDEPLLTQEELLIIVKQVAEGMVYISSLHLVHRDLATRNCLVATGLVVKIGDFGMSRNINESDYYRVHGSALLPVRWMSPESILYGKFTTDSDIWAFGILLWEAFTFGQQPYFGLQNEEVIQFIQKGGHPDPPEDCPAGHLMIQCWEKNPKKRPDFSSLVDTIQQLIEQQHQESE